MGNNLSVIIDYIIDNLLFGSEIERDIIDILFEKYPINEDEKEIVYDELRSLKIAVKESKVKFKQKISRLFKRIRNENKFLQSDIEDWFENENIAPNTKSLVISYLHDLGCLIISAENEEVESNSNKFDFLEDIDSPDLDMLLDDEEFNKELSKLEDVVDKSKNKDYLIAFHNSPSNSDNRKVALNNIVEANEKLVLKILRKYVLLKTPSFDEEDMFQAGVEGLLKAVEKFDIKCENQFSTYATWWINQSIERAIADYSTVIRLPVHMRENIMRLNRMESEFWKTNNRNATDKELAELLNFAENKIKDLKKYRNVANLVSFDVPINDEKDSFLGDFIIDHENKPPEVYFEEEELLNELELIFKEKLKDREKEIISLRFGLVDGHNYTLEEIGQIQGCTRERIRQIEAKVIKKLQNSGVKERLRGFYYDR